ncbi:MAG: phenylacetate-CoA oxygenase/reductase subunit PaaK [Flavobacteriales bacterium]|nr:phenylacetate-CoA oxygenase/reductase subunit PaaK [Flavobacteriales bacterium]
MRPKFHSLKVSDVRRETRDCVSVAFEVPAELAESYKFKQGQYLTLRETIDGEDLRRSYSICSGVHDQELRVAIKEVKNGKFSGWVNQELKPGHVMQVMTPTGHFTTELNPDQSKNYLLIAAGSGITPIMSIARSVLQTEPQSEVTIIFGNRLFHSIIFRDQLEDMKDQYLGRFRVFHVLSGEPNEVELFSGRIDKQKIEGFCKTFIQLEKTNEVFVCGPEPMIRAVVDFMKENHMPDAQIHFELFATPGDGKPAAPAAPAVQAEEKESKCAVTVVYDGQETNFYMPMNGTSILDAAQKSGMDIPFSCKGGMCCTCRAHVSEGHANMKVNYALEPGEVESGYVLTCQAVPTTEKITVDFDRH